MKYLFVALLLAGCSSGMITSDISGVYVRFAQGEYSKTWDTLVISVYDSKGSTYYVQQRSGFQKIRDGKLQPKEYDNEKSVVVYDGSTHQLQDLKTGLIYSFPKEGTLVAGHAEYIKIK